MELSIYEYNALAKDELKHLDILPAIRKAFNKFDTIYKVPQRYFGYHSARMALGMGYERICYNRLRCKLQ